MKISLSPMGTEGDIRPFIALGNILKESGHEVSLIGPLNAEKLCNKYSMKFHSIDYDYLPYVKKVAGNLKQDEIHEVLEEQISAQFKGLLDHAGNSDLIIGGALNFAVHHIAELYKIPYKKVWHTPQIFPSDKYAPWRFPVQHASAKLIKTLWELNDNSENRLNHQYINKQRLLSGIRPLKSFVGISRLNAIILADKPLCNYHYGIQYKPIVTDYWFLWQDTELPPDMKNFLCDDRPIIYCGFGSMPAKSGHQTVEILDHIAEDLDIKVIVQRGWAQLGQNIESNRIKVIGEMPHHKLFPHLSLIIHHGGAGTTHASALAGIPQIIIPQVWDQFFWGQRVAELNIGPPSLKESEIREEILLSVVKRTLEDRKINENAKAIGNAMKDRMSLEDTVKNLLDIIIAEFDDFWGQACHFVGLNQKQK